MNAYNQDPATLYAFNMEAIWTEARNKKTEEISKLRKAGHRVSFYRESMIVTFTNGIIMIWDLLHPGKGGIIVPSIRAALGVAYGRRFYKAMDWRKLGSPIN